MGSRIRENPEHIFECFLEVVAPTEQEAAWILQKYPEDFSDEETLKFVPRFAFPCKIVSTAVQHFSFVLTDAESKYTFGFCRQTPGSQLCLCILSFLPWHELFYKLLNYLSELTNHSQPKDLNKFLEQLYSTEVPEAGGPLYVTYDLTKTGFSAVCPDYNRLPSIPENRNLTEYFNAIDPNNMIIMFASLLYERRILITSKKLCRVTACVLASNTLLYPMHWQHIFIPVLPAHLIDYVSAPMPYLIGVPEPLMEQTHKMELGDVVILDADNNRIHTPHSDVATLPSDIVSALKRKLKNPQNMLGDRVARAFLRALVSLIGGYRDALRFKSGEKITFSEEAFILSRPSSMQPFLEKMLHLQIFQQFIEERLDMLNSGLGFSDEFEFEVNIEADKSSNKLKSQYKDWLNNMKKEGGAFLKNVKSKANPAVKHAYKSVKDKGKRAYKDLRLKFQELQHKDSEILNRRSLSPDEPVFKPKSAPSSPTSTRRPFTLHTSSVLNEEKITIGDSLVLKHQESFDRSKHYKVLDVEAFASEDNADSPLINSPGYQRISMDLMGDLKDIIFSKRFLERNASNNASDENTDNQTLKPTRSLESISDLSSPGDTPMLEPPVPPLRVKHRLNRSGYVPLSKPLIKKRTPPNPLEVPRKLLQKSTSTAPLIKLDSTESNGDECDQISDFSSLKTNVSESSPSPTPIKTTESICSEIFLQEVNKFSTPKITESENKNSTSLSQAESPTLIDFSNAEAQKITELYNNSNVSPNPFANTSSSYNYSIRPNPTNPFLVSQGISPQGSFQTSYSSTVSEQDQKLLQEYGLSFNSVLSYSPKESPKMAVKRSMTPTPVKQSSPTPLQRRASTGHGPLPVLNSISTHSQVKNPFDDLVSQVQPSSSPQLELKKSTWQTFE